MLELTRFLPITARRNRQEEQAKRDANDRDISEFFTTGAGRSQPKPKAIKTQDDDDFMAGLLGEVDTNIRAPTPRLPKHEKPTTSAERRKARALSPAQEPAQKKRKSVDTRLPSPSPINFDNHDDEGQIPPSMDDEALDVNNNVPLSDPAPSSPTPKASERKLPVKQEVDKEDEDEDMMEVAHAGAITAASVNIAGSRPVKKIIKQEPYPSPASSSPVKAPDVSVDSSEWNQLNDRLNVVSSSQSEVKSVGKIDYRDAIEADGSLNFFWTDYTEVNGSLCLFGKVLNKKTNSYSSSLVKVDNILRKLYFLPRKQRLRDGVGTGEDIDNMAVYTEIDELVTKMDVRMHKIKPCTRKYAFEMQDVPKEAEYLKLLYPYTSEPQSHCRILFTLTQRLTRIQNRPLMLI